MAAATLRYTLASIVTLGLFEELGLEVVFEVVFRTGAVTFCAESVAANTGTGANVSSKPKTTEKIGSFFIIVFPYFRKLFLIRQVTIFLKPVCRLLNVQCHWFTE